jgi:hypothetical protein
MPVLVASTPVLWAGAVGFALGAGAMSAACALLDHHRQRARRMVIGFAARSMQDSLATLAALDGLPAGLARHLAGLRDLAAAVARVASED